MRACANNWLLRYCGLQILYYPLGNAPITAQKRKFSEAMKDKYDAEGIKTFFYMTRYCGGDVELDPKRFQAHLWVTPEEMQEYLDKDLNDIMIECL